MQAARALLQTIIDTIIGDARNDPAPGAQDIVRMCVGAQSIENDLAFRLHFSRIADALNYRAAYADESLFDLANEAIEANDAINMTGGAA